MKTVEIYNGLRKEGRYCNVAAAEMRDQFLYIRSEDGTIRYLLNKNMTRVVIKVNDGPTP